MRTKVAINGFGRIGRSVFKILLDRDDVEIVAINDLTDVETLAHLLRFDTAYGQYASDVSVSGSNLVVGGNEIKMVSQPDPEKLPWSELGVEVVAECTGRFTSPVASQAHIRAGAKTVVLSAPAKGDGAEQAPTVIIGVNDHEELDGDMSGQVISNASCTTNCVSPVASVLESKFGVEAMMMTTIHSFTADQNLQDGPHRDLRRARAAADNIIPTTTGAAIATTRAISTLEGKFDGMAIRVPTITGSLIDFTAMLSKDTTVEDVNKAFIDAADQPYFQGIMTVTDMPIVSSDVRGDSHSSIVDLGLTNVVAGKMVKIVAWYDNEWGYSNRLAELIADVGATLQNGSGAADKAVSASSVNTASASQATGAKPQSKPSEAQTDFEEEGFVAVAATESNADEAALAPSAKTEKAITADDMQQTTKAETPLHVAAGPETPEHIEPKGLSVDASSDDAKEAKATTASSPDSSGVDSLESHESMISSLLDDKHAAKATAKVSSAHAPESPGDTFAPHEGSSLPQVEGAKFNEVSSAVASAPSDAKASTRQAAESAKAKNDSIHTDLPGLHTSELGDKVKKSINDISSPFMKK